MELQPRVPGLHGAAANQRPRLVRRPAALAEQDRRAAVRYPATVGRCWLGWRAGRDFPRLASWIIDLSSCGCLLASDDEPPPDAPVYLRLDGPFLPHWYPARVQATRRSTLGIRAIHLGFPDACPYELFMGVVHGRFDKPPE
jgi:hypothetical protein